MEVRRMKASSQKIAYYVWGNKNWGEVKVQGVKLNRV